MRIVLIEYYKKKNKYVIKKKKFSISIYNHNVINLKTNKYRDTDL